MAFSRVKLFLKHFRLSFGVVWHIILPNELALKAKSNKIKKNSSRYAGHNGWLSISVNTP